MRTLISRRALLIGALAAIPSLALRRALAAGLDAGAAQNGLADLERTHGGRLGASILDVETGKRIEHRGDERFAMCSTFKVLAAALILARVDRNQETLDRRIVYAKEKLVPYSPATEKHAGPEGMTLAAICEAALTLSDNTAANLMLESFGGPAQWTAYARSLGDGVTRLDRVETALNEARPGDDRDTTTPNAMLENLRRIVLGDALSVTSRDRLTRWLIANKTGDKRLRAGLPADWRVGDKTGTGDNGAAADIAVIWPPGRGPIIVTAYVVQPTASDDERDGEFPKIGELMVKL
jgi:beta-lactamase class A